MSCRNLVTVFLMFLVSLSIFSLNAGAEVAPALSSDIAFSTILNELDLHNVEDHIRTLTNIGSRVTGYEGCNNAAQYLDAILNSYGYDVFFHSFNVSIPFDYGSIMTISETEETFIIYSFEPNLIVPVTASYLTAKMVYVGQGKLDDYDDKPIQGSIVLMDFNSGSNWLHAARLGAEAVVFIEPTITSYGECSSKSVGIPFNFPRYLITIEDAPKLKNNLQVNPLLTVTISSSMIWEERQGYNLVTWINGTTNSERVVILSAHYDSYSVVPSHSPGANDVVGAATLLEIARLLRNHPPDYSVMLVFFSGYHQGLSGSRWFMQDYLYGRDDFFSKILLQINLQFSATIPVIATSNTGQLYELGATNYGRWSGLLFSEFNDYVLSMIDSLNIQTGKNFELIDGAVRASLVSAVKNRDLAIPVLLPNDCEPLGLQGGPGYSFITPDYAEYLHSPIDDFESLNLDFLEKNVQEVVCLSLGVLATNNLENYLSHMIEKYQGEVEDCKESGLRNSIGGKVVVYNETISFYSDMPNAFVHIDSSRWGLAKGFTVKTDNQGRFYIPQINFVYSFSYNLFEFKLDETTGNPLFLPTSGTHKWASSTVNSLVGSPSNMEIGFRVVFECSTLVIFDLTYPPLMGVSGIRGDLRALKHEILIDLDSVGYSIKSPEIAVIYLPPETAVDIIYDVAHLGDIPLAFLLNTTTSNQEGTGYALKKGEQKSVCNTALEFARSLYSRNLLYIDLATPFNLAPNSVEKNLQAQSAIHDAEQALIERRFLDAYLLSVKAWGLTHEAYSELRATIVDTAGTLPFFGLISLPFIVLLEAVLLAMRGRRKIPSYVAIFILLVLVFIYVHPGFSLSSSGFMIIMSLSVVVMTIPLVAILFSRIPSSLREFRTKTKGRHFVKISGLSSLIVSFQVGVENMRKRRMRSILTMFSIITIVVGLVMFASISAIKTVQPSSYSLETQYEGVYIRDTFSSDLGEALVDIVEARYSECATVLTRSWLYTASPADSDYQHPIRYLDRVSTFYAAVGLTPAEEVLPLVSGSLSEGRWFIPYEYDVCILPEYLATYLDVGVYDKIYALGRNLTVMGIIKSEIIDGFVELDGEGILPVDYTIPENEVIRASMTQTILVPYQLMRVMNLQFNKRVYSISIIPHNPADTSAILEEIRQDYSDLYLYQSISNEVTVFHYTMTFTLMGWEMQIVPFIIAAIMILNLMLGAIQERERDIYVYSTVGLSPTQVTLMFLAETSVYAVLGSLAGYLMGMFLIKISSNYIPMANVNYSSGWVMICIISTMLTTFISTFYPLIKVSRLVTPSLKRKWTLTTKPIEDLWSIPLPFVATNESEVRGLKLFLKEYLETQGGEASSFTAYGFSTVDEEGKHELKMDTRLAPYESGIIQHSNMIFARDQTSGRWTAEIIIKREAGSWDVWQRLNRKFVDELRKQMLIWRSLSQKERSKYMLM